MTEQQMKKLKIGDRVRWIGKQIAIGCDKVDDIGTVIDKGYHAITIQWDIGQTGTVDHKDGGNIYRE